MSERYALKRFRLNNRVVWQVWHFDGSFKCSASGYFEVKEEAEAELKVLSAEDRLRPATPQWFRFWRSVRYTNSCLRRGHEFGRGDEGDEEADWPDEDQQETLKFGKT